MSLKSIWNNFLCKVFGINCPPEPIEVDACSITGLLPNETCEVVKLICFPEECPVDICLTDHSYVEPPEPPKIVTRTICKDSNLVRRKHCVLKQKRQFIKGTEPTEKCDLVEHKYKRTITEYLVFDNAKVLMALTPGDLHDLNWKFHDGFTVENYVQVSEALSNYKVNSKRHFFHTGEREGDLDNYHVPFKRLNNGKFDLWNLDPEGWDEMKWRLQIDMDRGIIPIMCIAAGWKGFRYGSTAWHPSNNIGVQVGENTIRMTADSGRLFDDKDSHTILVGVAEMVVDALRDLKHPTGIKDPFIIEDVNEPGGVESFRLFTFHNKFFKKLVARKKLEGNRMAFEKWDSRWIGVKKIDDKVEPGLQDLYPGIWCFYHAQNTYAQAVRWHMGEMGKIHDAYLGLCADSDGCASEPQFHGKGLIGKNWGGKSEDIKFRRITPVELKQFLIYDYKHNGAGYVHLSAVCWYESDVAMYESFVKAFVKGFTKTELMEWQRMMQEHRGVPIPVDWELFSYEKDGKRYRLSEGAAVKQAMNVIHKEVT